MAYSQGEWPEVRYTAQKRLGSAVGLLGRWRLVKSASLWGVGATSLVFLFLFHYLLQVHDILCKWGEIAQAAGAPLTVLQLLWWASYFVSSAMTVLVYTCNSSRPLATFLVLGSMLRADDSSVCFIYRPYALRLLGPLVRGHRCLFPAAVCYTETALQLRWRLQYE